MIISINVLSYTGQVLVARRFVKDGGIHGDGYLAAFPQMVQHSDHSFIETDEVRFVYSEQNRIYIVLIVTKTSNLVSDLETVSLCADVLRKICQTVNEESILAHGADLLFGFDEIILDGQRRPVTFSDVGLAYRMKSAEEEEHLRQIREKEKQAADNLNKHGKQSITQQITSLFSQATDYRPSYVQPSLQPTEVYTKPSKPTKSGLQLGTQKNSRIRDVLLEEEGLDEASTNPSQTHPQPEPLVEEGMVIKILESLTAEFQRNGVAKEVALEGKLLVNASSELAATITVDIASKEVTWIKPMMQTNRKLFTEQKKLEYNNQTSRYRPGSEVTLLGWRITSPNANLPIAMTCFIPQSSKTDTTFSCEVELKRPEFVIESITVTLPIPSSGGTVNQCDGEYEIEDSRLRWTITDLGPDSPSAEIEITTGPAEENEFYPVCMTFESTSSIAYVDVVEVECEEEISVSTMTSCQATRYEID